MAYIGPEPRLGQNREVDDISSGFNGNTATFNLTVNGLAVSPGSANAILVSLGGVIQNPGTDYTVSTSTITFTTNPASGLSFFGLVLGQGVDTATVADGALIGSPILSGPSVTGDLSIADKIVHTGDTNTAFRFPSADTITAETGGSERLRIDSSGNVTCANDLSVDNNLKIDSGFGSTTTVYGTRAWIRFNGVGTVAITGSGNISALTDNGTGDYTVTFSTAMSDTNYAAVGIGSANGGNGAIAINTSGNTPLLYSTTQCRFCNSNTNNGTLLDGGAIGVAFIR